MNNMTFGEFMRWKRKASPEKYTLKDVSRKLGISLTMYSDIEMGRKKPAPNFDYEGIADMLGMTQNEKDTMYDLAAIKRNEIPNDIEDMMMHTETGQFARIAMRMTTRGPVQQEDWMQFVRDMEKKYDRVHM